MGYPYDVFKKHKDKNNITFIKSKGQHKLLHIINLLCEDYDL